MAIAYRRLVCRRLVQVAGEFRWKRNHILFNTVERRTMGIVIDGDYSLSLALWMRLSVCVCVAVENQRPAVIGTFAPLPQSPSAVASLQNVKLLGMRNSNDQMPPIIDAPKKYKRSTHTSHTKSHPMSCVRRTLFARAPDALRSPFNHNNNKEYLYK